MSYTVIVRAAGCVHTFNNLNRAAADLLCRINKEGEVEVWCGSDLIDYKGDTPRSIVERARALA